MLGSLYSRMFARQWMDHQLVQRGNEGGKRI
jgi:hypothetical protein